VDERGLVGRKEPALGARTEPGYIEFHAAGAPGTGDFRCAECGYGVCVARLLPTCPMCAGLSWERGGSRLALPAPERGDHRLPAD